MIWLVDGQRLAKDLSRLTSLFEICKLNHSNNARQPEFFVPRHSLDCKVDVYFDFGNKDWLILLLPKNGKSDHCEVGIFPSSNFMANGLTIYMLPKRHALLRVELHRFSFRRGFKRKIKMNGHTNRLVNEMVYLKNRLQSLGAGTKRT